MRKTAFLLLMASMPFIPNAAADAGSLGNPHRNCASTCHRTHGGKGDAPLLKKEGLDEHCLSCHDAANPLPINGEAAQIKAPSKVVSSHVNFRRERAKPAFLKRAILDGKRYFLRDDCSGCHNPHLTNGEKLKTYSFNERGEMQSARGRFVGELCLGCHAGTEAVKTLRAGDIGPLVSPAARSGHSIGATAASRKDLPSLRRNEKSRPLDCVSCHNEPGGKGLHYSIYPSLLTAPFARESDMASEQEASVLCYLCHSRESIEANESFPLHMEHVTGMFNMVPGGPRNDTRRRAESLEMPFSRRPVPGAERFGTGFGRPAACATCHDPHGSIENPFLISFDRTVVTASRNGRIEFRKTGPFEGYCTLSCHGHDHAESAY